MPVQRTSVAAPVSSCGSNTRYCACKPALKFEPRLGAGGQVQAQRRQWEPADPAPDDMEEDDDPFAVSSKPTAAKGAFASTPPPSAPQSYASQAAPAAPPQAYVPPRTVAPSYPPHAAREPVLPPAGVGPSRPMVLQPHLWTGSTIY